MDRLVEAAVRVTNGSNRQANSRNAIEFSRDRRLTSPIGPNAGCDGCAMLDGSNLSSAATRRLHAACVWWNLLSSLVTTGATRVLHVPTTRPRANHEVQDVTARRELRLNSRSLLR